VHRYRYQGASRARPATLGSRLVHYTPPAPCLSCSGLVCARSRSRTREDGWDVRCIISCGINSTLDKGAAQCCTLVKVTTLVRGAVRLHIYNWQSQSERAWYDCDCQASQSQLNGCDWPVRLPDYRVSDYGRLQSTGSKCRKKCFGHPLTVSVFNRPLSPLHYMRDGAPIGVANNALTEAT
jgi:hypothetical protein